MKLCPQCAFIYEDDQKVCDMDGQPLVLQATPAGLEPQSSAPTRLTIDLSAMPENTPARSSASRSQLLVVVLVILAALLSVVVIAQVRRSRASSAVPSPEPARSAAPNIAPEKSAADQVSSSSAEATTTAEEPLEPATEFAPADVAGPETLKRARLATSPVSAGASGGNSKVLMRLTNGATIKADEVWERKEGIWYRQAGMVTFLKRSQVRSIERTPPSAAPQRTAATKADDGIKKSDDRTAQNQLRIRRLETVETKKPSRVKSFLRLTGRILKKPFKS
jgi:hypothetical protein